MAKKSKNNCVEIDATNLSKLLRRANLGGILEECVLTIDGDGDATIAAIDMSSSVYIDVSESLGSDVQEMHLGLRNLTMITRYLQAEGVYKFTPTDEWLEVQRKGHGKIRINLLKPDEVPTRVDTDANESALDGLIDQCTWQFALTEKSRDDLTYYLSLLSGSSVVVKASSKFITFCSNENESNQFELRVAKNTKGETGTTEVYASNLQALLKVLSDEKEEPSISFGTNGPLVVVINPGNFWALTPLQEA